VVWILLVLLYGVLKGVREVFKKKALEKNSIMEVLFFYTLLSFIMVLPEAKNAFSVDTEHLLYIALKSFVIFIAWICSFLAIKKMPISMYGVLDLSRVLFSTLLGAFVLGEVLTNGQIIGLVLVMTGLLFLGQVRRGKSGGEDKVDVRYLLLAILSCLLNGVSGMMDKLLMKDVTSGQLQFWYMFFLTAMYFTYVLFARTKIHWKDLITNYWIWILSILFVIADRALFIANGMPDSKVTIMTLIKQSGCVVTILAGKFIFKEKNIGYKLLCAGIVVAGIVVAVI